MPTTLHDIADAVAMDQIVNRAILMVLLKREIDRGATRRELLTEIDEVMDRYLGVGKTPDHLTFTDRERARMIADLLVAFAGSSQATP